MRSKKLNYHVTASRYVITVCSTCPVDMVYSFLDYVLFILKSLVLCMISVFFFSPYLICTLLSHDTSNGKICPAEQCITSKRRPCIMEMCVLFIHFSHNKVILKESVIKCSVSISIKFLQMLVVIWTILTSFSHHHHL